MIEYRTFRNYDPPHLLRLWHECGLGRGAAQQFSVDAFDLVVFSQPYFDPGGLIVAVDGSSIVGFAHAGFCSNVNESGIDHSRAVVCAVMVLPSHRLQGIGRELTNRVQQFAAGRGAKICFAGPSPGRDPFYFGIYGGSQPSGFLQTDSAAKPFFEKMGFAPLEKHLLFQKSLVTHRDPISVKLMNIRRQMELKVLPQPVNTTWWWLTRFDRLDAVRCQLVPKKDGVPVAEVTVTGLDIYIPRWQKRGIGLTDLMVREPERRKGYGRAIVLEIFRRMKGEMVDFAEVHAPESNQAVMQVIKSLGFEAIDAGVVYSRDLQ